MHTLRNVGKEVAADVTRRLVRVWDYHSAGVRSTGQPPPRYPGSRASCWPGATRLTAALRGRRAVRFAKMLLLLLSSVSGAHAALPEVKPDEVIILYNKKLPESKGVADYYAEKRGVPRKQI